MFSRIRVSSCPVLFAVGTVAGVLSASAHAQSCTTGRVSVASNGAQANSWVQQTRMSADGRWVVFASNATNLVSGDANGVRDVFLHDRLANTTLCASSNSLGVPGNGDSGAWLDVADNGKVAFNSSSADLVANDINGNVRDVFVYDPLSHTTQLASVDSVGGQNSSGHPCDGARISGNGRYVAFASSGAGLALPPSNFVSQVYRRDLLAQTTMRVSVAPDGTTPANDLCYGDWLAISFDGRFVAFVSRASNLVPGNNVNNFPDLFVRDMQTGTTTIVALAPNYGTLGSTPVSFSADGRYLGYQGWVANHPYSVYVYDRLMDTSQSAALRLDGSYAGIAGGGLMSRDGRFVSFTSSDASLLPGHGIVNGGDVFVFDRATHVTERVSYGDQGQIGDNTSGINDVGSYVGAVIGDDHSAIAFESLAANLVPGDTNYNRDVFVRTCSLDVPEIYCTAKVNSLGCTPTISYSGSPSVSAGSGFTISATHVLNNRSGLLFYGLNGPQAALFQGGYLCVTPPTRRSAIQQSGGSALPANDCSGQFVFDFNAYIASGVDPILVQDQPVWAQFWSRDAASASTTNLTDAIAFVIEH